MQALYTLCMAAYESVPMYSCQPSMQILIIHYIAFTYVPGFFTHSVLIGIDLLIDSIFKNPQSMSAFDP